MARTTILEIPKKVLSNFRGSRIVPLYSGIVSINPLKKILSQIAGKMGSSVIIIPVLQFMIYGAYSVYENFKIGSFLEELWSQ